jgi:uncharacterized YccA/Bax inhibitor family protein
MRTQNPVLNPEAFSRGGGVGVLERPSAGPVAAPDVPFAVQQRRMTVEGTVYRTGLLLLLVVAAATLSWRAADRGVLLLPGLGASFFVLLGLGIATAFKPRWAIVTGPLYALASGVVLGAVSALYNAQYEGIVAQAVIGTLGTATGMLVAYRTGLIRATATFRKVVVSATLGIMLLYLVSIGMRLFGATLPLLHDTGPLGILLTLGIVVIAALNLVLDFDFIERAAKTGADQRMEWFGAFALTVTLVWLYLEILRLLSKLRR